MAARGWAEGRSRKLKGWALKSPSAWSRRAWLVRRTPPPAHHEHVYVGNLIRMKAREHTPTHPNRGRRQARSLASVFSDNL